VKQARIEAARCASTFTSAAVEARKLTGEVVSMEASEGGAAKLAFTCASRSALSLRSCPSTSP
jgi:hypothetical protein